MKILVTGGAGYIGENFIQRYNTGKYLVESCDYKTNNPLPAAQDLTEKDIQKYDAIVHLAALSGIMACENDPKKAVLDNIIAASNVFKLARKTYKPVVFTSSQAVKNPTSSVYAFMKWSCEQIAAMYNTEGGMIYVLRLSNVYGGHEYLEKKQTCVKQFITQYNNNEPLKIHGNGEQKRDFIHVFDVCEAIMKVFAFTPIEKDPMDIGTGKGISIMDLKRMFPKDTKIEFETGRSAGTDSSIADTTPAKLRIHFAARSRLKDYINEMII